MKGEKMKKLIYLLGIVFLLGFLFLSCENKVETPYSPIVPVKSYPFFIDVVAFAYDTQGIIFLDGTCDVLIDGVLLDTVNLKQADVTVLEKSFTFGEHTIGFRLKSFEADISNYKFYAFVALYFHITSPDCEGAVASPWNNSISDFTWEIEQTIEILKTTIKKY
jgi:hypothetical protein